MVEPLHDPQLERMIGGTGSPVQITDIAGSIVDLRRGSAVRAYLVAVGIGLIALPRDIDVSRGIYLRPQVTRTGERGCNHIGIIDTNG